MLNKSALLSVSFLALVLTGCSSRTANVTPSNSPFASDKQVKLHEFNLPTPTPSPRSPTPTPRVSPTPTSPSPTPTPTTCASTKIAVDLLLDTSTSMDHEYDQLGNISQTGRLAKLKTAVNTFSNNLQSTDIIGVQEFNGFPFDQLGTILGPDARVVQSFNTWSINRTTLSANITALQAKGSTHTRDGFQLALQEITAAKQAYPGYKWIMIFISDGVPKASLTNFTQPWQPDQSQDPRIDPNLATQIKNLGVEIFSIGIDLSTQPWGNDAYAKQLMREVASKPQDAFENATGDQLNNIYSSLAGSICR